MSLLPANFPVGQLSPAGVSKLEWFYRNHVEAYYTEYKFGHFLMAGYAAVPALLTPELLYKTWQNFNAYRWQGAPASIHPIAVSDILLSPLCNEVGYELYEMDQEIKLAMLEWLTIIENDKKTLWSKRGIHTISSIAGFVHDYHSLPNSGQVRWGKTYTEWQEVDALSYLNPELAASRLLQTMTEQSADKKEMDLLRTLEQFIKTQKKLNRIHPGNRQTTKAFNQNIDQLEAVKNLLENNSNAFLEQSNSDISLPNFTEDSTGTGITIRMPSPVQEKLVTVLSRKPKPRRRTIYAGIIGINEFAGLSNKTFAFCRRNAERFSAAITQYAEALQCDLEIFQPADTDLHQRDLDELYNFYNQSRDGDSCIFFYSGLGLMDNQYRVRDIIVGGDTLENLQSEDTRANMTVHLNNLVAKKNIHVLVITDLHGVIQVKRTFPTFLLPGYEGSILFLKNFDNDDDWLSNVETGIMPPEINNFCHSLFEILAQGGYRFNYHEIFSQLKLRMSSLGASRPAKYSFPEKASQLMFLTGDVKKINSYTLSYNPDRGWMVNAGLRQGVRPSMPFMETFFRDENGNRYAVDRVENEFSTIRNFEENTEKTFTLTLAQNAFPKIRVAFAETINPEMRASLLNNISRYNINYIELVEDRNSAYYLIDTREDAFVLMRRENISGNATEQAPVYDAQRSEFEFIKAMEYIAQWQGVLEFDNRETILGRDQVWFEFEKIEGRDINNEDIESLTGEIIPDYEPVVLHYRKVGENWVAPSLRCRITRAQRPLYVTVLYLDALYGILILGNAQAEPGSGFLLSGLGEMEGTTTFELQLPQYFVDKGITEATEYMKFFISESPIDLAALTQQSLAHGTEALSRNLENINQENRNLLDTTNSEWVSVTIPIVIVQKEISRATLENPFPGLHAFKQADSGIFFGRKAALDQLLQAARQYRILIVSGVAGSGKTSLVNAGLLPLVEGEKTEISLDALSDINILRREADAITGKRSGSINLNVQQLNTAANARASSQRSYVIIDNYQHILRNSGGDIEEMETIINDLSYEVNLIILIKADLEVLFRNSPVVGLEREKGSGRIIGTIRKDAWRMEVPQPNTRELREIIIGLSATAKLQFDEDLINTLVKDSLQANRPLAQLSAILYQLAQSSVNGYSKSTIRDYFAAADASRAEVNSSSLSFRDKVLQHYRLQTVQYADDPQRGRWGGKSSANDKTLKASLQSSEIKNLYQLNALVDCDSAKDQSTGQVAFFIADDFAGEIEFTEFNGGKAPFEKSIYEPFTIGAFTEDGTMLELDLATVTPFTPDFHTKEIPDNFEERARTTYDSIRKGFEGNADTGNWYGVPVTGNKVISATVEKLEYSNFFRVHIRIRSHQSSDPLRGSVAFFLHKSYAQPVVFRKAVNGEFSLTITAWEAFIIGALPDDGKMLELDLNSIPGLPQDFYSRSNNPS